MSIRFNIPSPVFLAPEYLEDLSVLSSDDATDLVVTLCVFPRVPAEFEDGDDDGEAEAAEEHHEHAADVLHAQRVRLRVLALVLK